MRTTRLPCPGLTVLPMVFRIDLKWFANADRVRALSLRCTSSNRHRLESDVSHMRHPPHGLRGALA